MKLFIILFSTALIAAVAAADPSTLPTTTQATAVAAPNPYDALHGMSRDYVVLTTRSIFLKGSQTVDPSKPINPPPPPPPIPYSAQESSVEFNGASRADQNRTAFFENIGTHEVLMRHAGDSIARGKILNITLDSIDYQNSAGRTTTIMIGQTLDGQDGPSMATAPSISMSSTQPTGIITGPNAAMLEQLRQKRLKELGQ